MEVSVVRPALRPTAFAVAVGVNLLIAARVFAQAIAPAAQGTTSATAEVEQVIVTGSNIPTAEETGPNPVDTYRPEDIEKLGARNPTDFLTKLPQQMGSTINQNANGVAGGDGAVIPNLRGLLPKETLVLIDGKRAAIIGSGGGVGAGDGRNGRSRTRNCYRLKYSKRRRSGTESGGYLSPRRHCQIRRAQCNRPADQAAAANRFDH